MEIDHRRPLVAFIAVTVLCAVMMVQTTLFVIRSPLGGGLAAARGLVSSLGIVAPPLVPELVTSDTLAALPGASAGTVETEFSPVLDLPEIAPALGSGAQQGGATAAAAPGGAAGDTPAQAAVGWPVAGRPRQHRTRRP